MHTSAEPLCVYTEKLPCVCICMRVWVEFENIHASAHTHTPLYILVHVYPTPKRHCCRRESSSRQPLAVKSTIARRFRINDMQSPFSKCAGPVGPQSSAEFFQELMKLETVTPLLAFASVFVWPLLGCNAPEEVFNLTRAQTLELNDEVNNLLRCGLMVVH